ncbi:non-ribosomal peptide synthase [Candidatus Vecturithrix granuli]|uniref:Non-ribosomal peptide synthase n=1 Tax=Vecturithrix granuli TaxID=1499967 RepID=A0A081BVR9_VECG1|nr:non-ribosomal peptide synthase [Candidatus Vecturithrix granuli]
MKSFEELLAYLQQRDIQLWAEGQKLRYNAPKGALTSEIRNELKEHKADLLTFLQQTRPVSGSYQIEAIRPVPRDGKVFPLSFNQEQLWVEDQLEGNKAIYNLPVGWRIFGPLNIPLLEQSFTEIVRRHEALRTIFPTVQGSPVQKILPPWKIQFPLVDLQHISQGQRDDEARRLAFEAIELPFDLAEGPLFRGVLFRLGPEAYIFVLSIHHIISDVWSVGILVQELSALYSAYWANKPSPLPELSIQYADFASWQRQWLSGKELESHLHFWKQQLAGIPPVLELPLDQRRARERNFAHGVEFFWIDADLLTQLKALSRKSGVTFFITILAAFAVFLKRYSRQNDVVIGSSLAGRGRTEVEPLIGFFINVLPFRIDLSGNPTFSKLLSQVRQVTADVFAHQDVPFVKLVELLHSERNINYPPIFQAAIDLKSAPVGELKFPELTISMLKGERGTPGVVLDLTLALEETGSEVLGAFEYNKNLFETSTITRMITHFQTLLTGIVREPQQVISQLPLLSEIEQRQILVEWNDTQTEFPTDICIHQLFEKQANRTPHATAVIFEDQQLTYQELNCRANQLAHYLQKLGVEPEVLVGLCLDRSLEMIIGILGVLKAGGAYLPLDPAYPQERLAFMISDAQIPILLTQEHLRAQLPDHHVQVITLDTDWSEIAQEAENNPQNYVSPDNLAYVIYTSGSTGRPKGTLLAHRGLCNLVYSQAQIFKITPQSRVFQFVSFSFDVATSDIFTTLCTGAILCLASRESLLPGPGLVQLLQNLQITHFGVPASILGALPYQELSALTTIIVGGEPCAPEIIERWGKGRQFLNAYGPTETTICTTTAQYTGTQQKLPIGRPLSNVTLYVLDAALQPVPVGVPGELYIGGIGLARGYLAHAALTAEKFIPNPFDNRPGSRMYKTGDLVRYLPDGNVEFLGRIDHQVKIRGFRIELGEIEATIASHRAIRDAVVLVREDQPGQKRLVAYIVLKTIQSLSTSELRQFLNEKLPDYMVPVVYVMLDALPLTPNGKIDRRVLPAPETISDKTEKIYVAPRTSTEEILVQIWKEVLKLEKIGIYDDFFEAGGHSLLAAQLMSKIQQQFNQNIRLSLLFESPTIAQLAEAISQTVRTEAFFPLVSLQAQGITQPFFAVHPGNGQIFCYTELARQLGSMQRFYGLQAFGLDPATSPLTSVTDMAHHYIQAVRSVQPQGPYLFGGFCIGGIIAYEMAQQFRQQGEEITLLLLLDTLSPHLYERMEETFVDDDVQHFMVFGQELGTFFGKDLIPIYAGLRNIDFKYNGIQAIRNDLLPLSHQERIKILLICAQRAGIPLPEESIEYLERMINVHRTNALAIFDYRTQPYSASPVVLLRAADNQMNQEFDAALGWRKYVPEELLHIQEVPGDHFSMLRMPHVRILSEKFKEALVLASR